jgi:hypothetical protein
LPCRGAKRGTAKDEGLDGPGNKANHTQGAEAEDRQFVSDNAEAETDELNRGVLAIGLRAQAPRDLAHQQSDPRAGSQCFALRAPFAQGQRTAEWR